MPDDQNGNKQVEERQPASMPEAEKTQQDDSLPEGVSDRTKEQFEKLKQHNQELQKQLEEAKSVKADDIMKSVPQLPKIDIPPLPNLDIEGLTKKQVNDVYDNVIDENGYIDVKLFKQTLKNLQQEVKEAKEEARRVKQEVSQTEESSQVRVAHKKYPMLDPKSKDFNPAFFNAVKNDLIGQMISNNGKKNLIEAADRVADWMGVKAPATNPTQSSNKEEQIRQINTLGSSNNTNRTQYQATDEDELAKRTMRGDREALLERLKRAGA